MSTEIKVTPNHGARTFTIRKYDNGVLYAKYRTTPATSDEFNNDLHMTDRDWKQYLSSGYDYYLVR